MIGALARVESNGEYVIRGAGCPLSAVTGKHPAVCQAVESLVGEIVGAPVRECCDRTSRPKCCFEIAVPSPQSAVVLIRQMRFDYLSPARSNLIAACYIRHAFFCAAYHLLPARPQP
jgi:hypothetical protein